MKNKKGITLIEVMIAVIVLVIIATFSILYSSNITDESKLAKVYNEINIVKDAIEESMVLIEINPEKYSLEYFFGEEVSVGNYNVGVISKEGTWYHIGEENYKTLDLRNIDREYLYNASYKELFLVNGFERNGIALYRYEEIIDLYEDLYR